MLSAFPCDVLGMIAAINAHAARAVWPLLTKPYRDAVSLHSKKFIRELAWCRDHGSCQMTSIFDRLHSFHDEPAYIDGCVEAWYHRGELHRVGKPARISHSHVYIRDNGRLAVVSYNANRYDADAAFNTDGKFLTSGCVSQWFKGGVPFRDDGGPHVICGDVNIWLDTAGRVISLGAAPSTRQSANTCVIFYKRS